MKHLLKTILISTVLLGSQVHAETDLHEKAMDAISQVKKIKYPAIIALNISNQKIIFEECFTKNSCRPIGNDEGYVIDDMKFHPTRRKVVSSIAVIPEAAIGAVAAAFGWQVAAAIGIASGAGAGILTVGTIVGAGTVGSVCLYFNALNPFHQWKKANVEKQVQGEGLRNKSLILSFENDNAMATYREKLEDVLKSVK